jgi:7,8-dihydropterin-6-yl-methyl-4-(beta-D-ribofuranosyl)aminobenzene 5'-phosphate synthase
MKLTIVYDNEVYKKGIGLKSDWGFSCLIETEDVTILFDTGTRGNILLNNMKKLDMDPSKIDKIVISHEHGDHNGGLKTLVPFVDDVELYRLKTQSPSANMHPLSVEHPQKIAVDVYTTGRLKGSVDEQSLILRGKKVTYVIVGCSHPGVEKILNTAKLYGDIKGLVGGLHGFDNFSILEELDFICPCHCTQHKRDLKELYPKSYSGGGVGKILTLI